MPVPHVPPEQLAAALAHLEHASAAASSGDRSAQQSGTRAVLQWKRQLSPTEASSLVYARHVLASDSSPTAAFHAASVLGLAATRCFRAGGIDRFEAWEVWVWTLDCAVAMDARRETRLVGRSLVDLLARSTKAGWRVEGWSPEQRQEMVERVVGLLAWDPARPTRLETGLGLATALADNFNLLDRTGEVKRRVAGSDWAEDVEAHRAFEALILPTFMRATLETVSHALDRDDRLAVKKALATLSELLAWRSEDLSHIDPSSLVDNTVASLSAAPRGDDVDPVPFPSSCLGFLDDPILHLFHRAHGVLWTAVVDPPQHAHHSSTNGYSESGHGEEDALTSCEASILSLIRVSSSTLPAARRIAWRRSTGMLIRLLLDRLSHVSDARRRYGPTFADRLTFFCTAVKAHLSSSSHIHEILPLSLHDAPSSAGSKEEQGLSTILASLVTIGEAAGQMMVLPGHLSDLSALEDADSIDQDSARVFESVASTVVDLHSRLVPLDPHSRTERDGRLVQMTRHAASTLASSFANAKLSSCRIRALLAPHAENGIHVEDQDVAIGNKDRTVYSDLLVSFAQLARLDPVVVLGGLRAAVRGFGDEVRKGLRHETEQGGTEGEKEREAAFEGLHWSVLMAGAVLADEGEGETPTVPEEIAMASEAFARSEARSQGEDPVVGLPIEVLQLVGETTLDPLDPAMERCSPQVAETLIWFCGRWALSYLLVPSSSPTTSHFNGERGMAIASSLVATLSLSLTQWSSDPSVLLQIADALSTLSRSSEVARAVGACPAFGELAEKVVRRVDVLPQECVGGLVAAMVKILAQRPSRMGIGGGVGLEEVVAAVEGRMARSVREGWEREEGGRWKGSSTLEMLVGLVDSIRPSTASGALVLATVARSCPWWTGVYVAVVGRAAEVELGVWKLVKAVGEAMGQGVVDCEGSEGKAVVRGMGEVAEAMEGWYARESTGKGEASEGSVREVVGVVLESTVSLAMCPGTEDSTAKLVSAATTVLSRHPSWLKIPALGRLASSALLRAFSDPGVVGALVRQRHREEDAERVVVVVEGLLASAVDEVAEDGRGACRAIGRNLIGLPMTAFVVRLVDHLVLLIIRRLFGTRRKRSGEEVDGLVDGLRTLLGLRGREADLGAMVGRPRLVDFERGEMVAGQEDWSLEEGCEGEEEREARARQSLARLWDLLLSEAWGEDAVALARSIVFATTV